jgi:hypothetical protein
MATAMLADCTMMSQLTNAITEVASQLNAKSNEIIELKSRLRRSNSHCSNNINDHGSSQSKLWTNIQHCLDCSGYCWTQGYLVPILMPGPAAISARKATKRKRRKETMGSNEQ